jgi:glutamine synthetase
MGHVVGIRKLCLEGKMDNTAVLKRLNEEDVHYLRLIFTDITGILKNVEVPYSQFKKAIEGDIAFDGSSIKGFARIEESDMLLKPDLNTLMVFPWDEPLGKVAGLVCDVAHPDDSPFEGCPRSALKKVLKEAADLGYTMNVGPELEFFLFQVDKDGHPTTATQDKAGYFDLAPVDKGEECRKVITNALESLGYEIEASHHEVAYGQHEIDFKYAEALECADKISTFRWVVRKYASEYGLHATFMPKPVFGINGSGMHCNQSLFRGKKNAFHDPKGEHEISDIARMYVAGLLNHSKALVFLTNPLVNSYKRLVPGYEAPTNIAWSMRNRSPLIRVPSARGSSTRVEFRVPDPSCNPYLAIAAMLKAGLDGIEKKTMPMEPVNRNIYSLSQREKRRLKIDTLPSSLNEAMNFFEKDKVIQSALGEHITENLIAAKRREWSEYISSVHHWEIDRYLKTY